MPKRLTPKGIFCLEGEWSTQYSRHSSVRPVLELLGQWQACNVPFIHRDVATRAELDHYVGRWCQNGAKRYPILYLAFHGNSNVIYLGDGRRGENCVALDDLARGLAGCCARRIIYFGSCGTLDVHGHALNRFLRETGALAVCGYQEAVDWLQSSAFDLLVFAAMQSNALTKSGANAMRNRILRHHKEMAKSLGFRMVVKK